MFVGDGEFAEGSDRIHCASGEDNGNVRATIHRSSTPSLRCEEKKKYFSAPIAPTASAHYPITVTKPVS